MNGPDASTKPPRPVDLAQEADFSLGGLRVSPSLRKVAADAWQETLEPRVMQVLVVLAEARGAVVSRDALIARCWGGRIVGDDAIGRCIGRIRQLAQRTGPAGFGIETVPRVGYRLAPGPGGDTRAPHTAAVAPARRFPGRALAGGAALLACAGGALLLWPRPPGAWVVDR
jgi:DNA-binding winged helix-turn-helix (wHTH) protein